MVHAGWTTCSEPHAVRAQQEHWRLSATTAHEYIWLAAIHSMACAAACPPSHMCLFPAVPLLQAGVLLNATVLHRDPDSPLLATPVAGIAQTTAPHPLRVAFLPQQLAVRKRCKKDDVDRAMIAHCNSDKSGKDKMQMFKALGLVLQPQHAKG
jgi:hypothetical protein